MCHRFIVVYMMLDVSQVPILSSAAKGHLFWQVSFMFMKLPFCNFCPAFHIDVNLRSFDIYAIGKK